MLESCAPRGLGTSFHIQLISPDGHWMFHTLVENKQNEHRTLATQCEWHGSTEAKRRKLMFFERGFQEGVEGRECWHIAFLVSSQAHSCLL